MGRETDKIHMLFDGSVLMNGLKQDSGRSGVFYVAYQLLNRLSQKNNVDITILIPDGSNYEAQNLKRQGVIKDNSISIITTEMPEVYYSLLKFSTQNKDSLGKKIIRFIIYRFKRLSKFYCLFKLKKLLKRNYYNVYFSPLTKIPDVIQKDKNIKRYMMVYDFIPVIMKDFYNKFGIIRMQNMEKTLLSLSLNNIYFTDSEWTKKDLLKYYPNMSEKNVIVSYPAANNCNNDDSLQKQDIREKYGIPKNKKYVLSLGSVEPRKNTIFAIKNYLKFVEENNVNDLIFVVAGGVWKEYKKVYDEFISSIKNENIINVGYVADEDIYELYSDAFLFVSPTLYEGFGLPVLEAMIAGCPVITSNVSSIPEVIGDAGITINPESDIDIINAYKKMYFDENFRNTCIEKGLERAKMFSWDKCTDIIYEKMCEDLSSENIV